MIRSAPELTLGTFPAHMHNSLHTSHQSCSDINDWYVTNFHLILHTILVTATCYDSNVLDVMSVSGLIGVKNSGSSAIGIEGLFESQYSFYTLV